MKIPGNHVSILIIRASDPDHIVRRISRNHDATQKVPPATAAVQMKADVIAADGIIRAMKFNAIEAERGNCEAPNHRGAGHQRQTIGCASSGPLQLNDGTTEVSWLASSIDYERHRYLRQRRQQRNHIIRTSRKHLETDRAGLATAVCLENPLPQ